MTWGSPCGAQVSVFGRGRLEKCGGFREEELLMPLRCRLGVPVAGVGGSRTRRWGLQGEGTRVTWREVGALLKGTAGLGDRLRGRRGLRTV